MKKISSDDLKRLHSLTLNMASEFVEFCNENDLCCYLCGGGCIGTIRHKGWIPWDDDLDFFMPRDDYEKAIILWKQQKKDSRYKLEVADRDHIDGNLFFVIRDSQTTYIKPYQSEMDITQGIVLDVLPLDGYPDSRIKRGFQCFWALVYSLFRAQIVPTNHGPFIRFIGKTALTIIRNKQIRYCIYKFAEKRMTKYKINECSGITELCSGPGYMKNWYPKDAFSKAVFLPFEDRLMPVPVGYDKYLKIAFGNYMIMPPIEKRISSHDVVFMDLNTPYTAYRGIYYLRGEKNG